MGFTQRTVWHAPVLAVKASIPALQFAYFPKLVARQQQFPCRDLNLRNATLLSVCFSLSTKQAPSEIRKEHFLSSEKKTLLPRRIQSQTCPPNNMVEFTRHLRVGTISKEKKWSQRGAKTLTLLKDFASSLHASIKCKYTRG